MRIAPISAQAYLAVLALLTSYSPRQQSTGRASSSNPSALSSQDREAQKHYRVAQEAIKNNDFSTATDELRAASNLAAKNSVIWYNLAVVESKNGDPDDARLHLQKAEIIGLPKRLQADADQLDAKLEYLAKSQAKKDAFNVKLQDLPKKFTDGANCDNGGGTNPGRDWFAESSGFDIVGIQPNTRTVSIRMNDTKYNMPKIGPPHNTAAEGIVTFDLADLNPDVAIQQQPSYCENQTFVYLLVIRAKTPGAFHFKGSTSFLGTSTVTPWVDGDALALAFGKQEAASTAAALLSEVIRMSADIQ